MDDGDGSSVAAPTEAGAPDSAAGTADGSLRDVHLDCPSPCRDAHGSADEPDPTTCPLFGDRRNNGLRRRHVRRGLRLQRHLRAAPSTWSSSSNPNVRSDSGTRQYWLKLDATHNGTSLRGTMVSAIASPPLGSGHRQLRRHPDLRLQTLGSSRDCSDSEASFLDQNALNYQTGDASYVMAKLADGASCAPVRPALP